MRFRTRPVEVDAIAVTDLLRMARHGDESGLKEWFNGIQAAVSTSGVVFEQDNTFPILAEPGDWVVRHDGGRLSVIKPAVFADTFDPILQP